MLPRRQAVKSLKNLLGQSPFFWRTHGGAELDLPIVRGQHRHGFEIKRTDAPRVTPSMRGGLR